MKSQEIRINLFDADSSDKSLDAVKEEWKDCKKCALSQFRKKVVCCIGERRTTLLAVGQWPGKDEDETGIPFTGKIGLECKKILTGNGRSIPPNDVSWTNILGCRIPEDKNFRIHYMQQCLPRLESEISIVSPKIIVAIGRIAVACLSGDNSAKLSEFAGTFIRYKGIRTFCMNHPAKLARITDSKAREAFRLVLEREAKLLHSAYLEVINESGQNNGTKK